MFYKIYFWFKWGQFSDAPIAVLLVVCLLFDCDGVKMLAYENTYN